MGTDSCARINLADAASRLPGPQKENLVTLFEHGSLVTKLYAPRVSDPQTPHSRDEVYVVAQGTGEFVCGGSRQPFQPLDVLFVAAGASIALKTSPMILRSGFSSTDLRVAKSIKGDGWHMFTIHSTTPCFPVADVGATIRWYENELGFTGDAFPSNEPFVFGILRRDDVEIMLQLVLKYRKPDSYNLRDGGAFGMRIFASPASGNFTTQ